MKPSELGGLLRGTSYEGGVEVCGKIYAKRGAGGDLAAAAHSDTDSDTEYFPSDTDWIPVIQVAVDGVEPHLEHERQAPCRRVIENKHSTEIGA